MGHDLRAVDVHLGYADRPVIAGLDLDVPPGRITVVLGPNACGKSTLLRGLGRLLRPSGGQVVLDGADIHSRPTKEVATLLGLLPQQPVAPDGITVADLVARGRHPHQSWFAGWTAADDAIVSQSLAATSTLELAARPVDALSGGQRQRVWIAMALAQQTDIVLLDEPTTFLDVTHQVEVLELLTALNEERGTTVVMVLHDINLAARYAHHVVLMRGGAMLAAGPPADVVTASLIEQTYDLPNVVVPDPVTGSPMVVPLGGRRQPRTMS